MIALSIKLPDELAESSKTTARKLGITRSELIRRALARELWRVEAAWEREAMAQSLQALGRDARYQVECDEIDERLDEYIAEEKDAWWRG